MAEFCPYPDCKHYRIGLSQLAPRCQKCKRRVHCATCELRLDEHGRCQSCATAHLVKRVQR